MNVIATDKYYHLNKQAIGDSFDYGTSHEPDTTLGITVR